MATQSCLVFSGIAPHPPIMVPEVGGESISDVEDSIDAMAELASWLTEQKASASQDFALGPQRFSRMLKATEAVDISLNELTRVARADLARNQAAANDACAEFAPGETIEACFLKMNHNKPAEGPVAAATA